MELQLELHKIEDMLHMLCMLISVKTVKNNFVDCINGQSMPITALWAFVAGGSIKGGGT